MILLKQFYAIEGVEIEFQRLYILLQHRITSYNVCYTKLLRKAAGIDAKSVSVRAHSHPQYYPNACDIEIKLCYGATDRLLLGAQMMGTRDTALRIDPFASYNFV